MEGKGAPIKGKGKGVIRERGRVAWIVSNPAELGASSVATAPTGTHNNRTQHNRTLWTGPTWQPSWTHPARWCRSQPREFRIRSPRSEPPPTTRTHHRGALIIPRLAKSGQVSFYQRRRRRRVWVCRRPIPPPPALRIGLALTCSPWLIVCLLALPYSLPPSRSLR